MALVTADDVQVRLGRDLTVSQRAQVDAWSVSYTHLTLPTNREV